MLGLYNGKVIINCEAQSQRQKIKKENLKIDTPTKFIVNTVLQEGYYVAVVAAIGEGKLREAQTLPKELREYEDVFSLEKAVELPILKDGDYIIKIGED